MRREIRVVLLGLVFALWASAAGDSEKAIREVIQRYMAARNSVDVAALRALFTAEADQLVSSGTWRRGLENLIAGAVQSSQKENGKSTLVVESVRMLNGETALVDARYETVTGNAAPRKMWSAFVLVKRGDDWKIAAIRNMLPAGQ